VQACSNDPQVAVHAIRNLARLGMGVVSIRWSQLGFGCTSSTSRDQATARNLFGFKDGTANLKAEETDLLRDQLWCSRATGRTG
jgi:deferrochelatase/peroxidase EfeB